MKRRMKRRRMKTKNKTKKILGRTIESGRDLEIDKKNNFKKRE